MQVVKRDGRRETVSFDKILARVQILSSGIEHVDSTRVAQKTVSGLRDGVHTSELDVLAAETAAYMSTEHPNYSYLAARIELSNLAKSTPKTLLESAERADLAADFVDIVRRNADELEAALDHKRDERYDFFAVRTLMKSYLRVDSSRRIVERPQHMLMRIAVGIHGDEIADAIDTYHALSLGKLSHATPTMFNAGTKTPQLASCFLMRVPTDSIDGIFEAVTWSAKISKHAGGIGIDVTSVRSKGSTIRGSGGTSNGLVPMLQVFDRVARYVDQGGGKRKGAIAIYIEPWHPDIFDILEMKKNHGKEEMKARDLFYGLWIPDEFMRRVRDDGDWSLICPDVAPNLLETWGDTFDEAYLEAEALGVATRVVKARTLWTAILDAQIETGTPYMLYKDACNRKSNHQHLGALRCSNLCTEILEYVSADETAVCNLASIALPACLPKGATSPDDFQFEELVRLARLATRNLNRVIDRSFYPTEQARRSNTRHRPIGIGVQGLADVFQRLNVPFDGDVARKLNRDIFEHIYFGALSESIKLAKVDGSYASFEGSPLSKGLLQPDMWGVELDADMWALVREEVVAFGARNSLLVAPMPTASTAQILGNTECFEPITTNMYTRRVLAGEFPVVNRHLVTRLEKLGLWNVQTRETIIRDNGSVQNIAGLDEQTKIVFRTVWEMKMRGIIDMAADRGAFIDQSQSLNLFMDNPTHAKLTSMHLHAWEKGLKTGQYYLRTRAGADAAKVSVCVLGKGGSDCMACSA